MKTIITVTAPTVYQLQSLREFKLRNSKKCFDGSFLAWQEFDTIKEAREYLKELAFEYYDGITKDIRYYLSKNSLEIDACRAHIITGQERKDFLESVSQ